MGVGGFAVGVGDELFESVSFDAPLGAAADLDADEVAAADQGVGLGLADVQLLGYLQHLGQGEEPGCGCGRVDGRLHLPSVACSVLHQLGVVEAY